VCFHLGLLYTSVSREQFSRHRQGEGHRDIQSGSQPDKDYPHVTKMGVTRHPYRQSSTQLVQMGLMSRSPLVNQMLQARGIESKSYYSRLNKHLHITYIHTYTNRMPTRSYSRTNKRSERWASSIHPTPTPADPINIGLTVRGDPVHSNRFWAGWVGHANPDSYVLSTFGAWHKMPASAERVSSIWG